MGRGRGRQLVFEGPNSGALRAAQSGFLASAMATSLEGSDCSGRSLPSSSSSSRRGQCEVKRAMVDMELDAARALADLAGMAVPPQTGAESADSSDGEMDYCESSDSRSNKRSKSESPVRAQNRSSRDPNSSKSEGSRLNARGHEGLQVRSHNPEVINLNVSCPAGNSSGAAGGRAKHNLTETEREARRLRRILANRESARQTIRRRQALREELTRRVADLSIQNENMKMEKEQVLKEYLSLRGKNEQLKEQIAKTEKTVCVSTAEAETSPSSPSTPPFFMYAKSPFVPHIVPSWISNSPDASALYEHGDPSSSAGAAVSLYVPPCAWYYPFVHELPGTSAQNPLAVDRNADDSDRRQPMLRPYLSMGGEDKSHVADRKPEALFTAFGNRQKNCAASSKSVSGRMQKEVITSSSEDNDMLSMTIGLSLEDKGETRHDTGVQEKLQSACTRPPEKFASAAAAAEARKRRKELTKLKHLGGR